MVSNTPEVKHMNIEIIRRAIQTGSSFTKAEISKITGLSMATCNIILNEMYEAGEILLYEVEAPSIGRPSSRFCYNRDHLHVAAAYVHDEEGRNTVVCVVGDALGRVICERSEHPDVITYAGIEEQLSDMIRQDGLIRFITIGIPGVSRNGTVERCDVDSLTGINVEERIRDSFGLPAEVRNDMDYITRGAFSKICDPEDKGTLATLYFPKSEGTVGAGMIIKGRILTGGSWFSGEVSYIAEAFGTTRKEQVDILNNQNRAAFRKLAAKMTMTLIGTVDPERIVLMGNGIGEEDLADIRHFCAHIVTDRHVPIFIADNDIHDNYLRGLIRTALNRLQFPLTRG